MSNTAYQIQLRSMCFSGGHFNPAVTLGATLAGALSPLLAAGYVLAQIFGAILGAAFVRVCIEYLPY